jgi:hypothetical protein
MQKIFDHFRDVTKMIGNNGSKRYNCSLLFHCSFLLPDESGQVLQKRIRQLAEAPKKITSLFLEAALFDCCTTVAYTFDPYS